MNEQLRPPTLPATTQAAEGLARRRFTVAEVESMVEAGIIANDERIELIGGEVVPISPKGNRHEILKKGLQRFWFQALPADVDLITETTLRTGVDTYVEPDFLFFPRSVRLADVTGPAILLIVEVADKSLDYDLGRKAAIYSAIGVREYWVVNSLTLETRVHREPSPTGFRFVTNMGPEERMVPLLVPALAVTLGKLELS
ncbi:MAG TPA: Uma2 family endonuclease [Hyphomicrobiaceae bacterium]|nr:Uma2 family endonuclease [Hyphomicrobiaceae bacterium]